jgi:hypothetical protein
MLNPRLLAAGIALAVLSLVAASGQSPLVHGALRNGRGPSVVTADGDTAADDDTGYAPDYWEAHCEGFSFPECGTNVDVPPLLEAVTVIVDGETVGTPVSVWTSSEVKLHITFAYPNGPLAEGHVFVVKADEAVCLDLQGRPFENPATENDVIHSESPIDWPVDPSLFLNGEGAPYFVEISNGCGTHSNRLPLEIVAKKDKPEEGCGGCGG